MKKTVRLTESDLTRIVKRIMNEGVVIYDQYTSKSDPDKVIDIDCTKKTIAHNAKEIAMEPQVYSLFCR
jgi:hypothetical protein